MKLSDAKIGEKIIIAAVGGDARARLESMGIRAGQPAAVERFAPANGALLVRVNGIAVVMRREIARFIEVQRV